MIKGLANVPDSPTSGAVSPSLARAVSPMGVGSVRRESADRFVDAMLRAGRVNGESIAASTDGDQVPVARQGDSKGRVDAKKEEASSDDKGGEVSGEIVEVSVVELTHYNDAARRANAAIGIADMRVVGDDVESFQPAVEQVFGRVSGELRHASKRSVNEKEAIKNAKTPAFFADESIVSGIDGDQIDFVQKVESTGKVSSQDEEALIGGVSGKVIEDIFEMSIVKLVEGVREKSEKKSVSKSGEDVGEFFENDVGISAKKNLHAERRDEAAVGVAATDVDEANVESSEPVFEQQLSMASTELRYALKVPINENGAPSISEVAIGLRGNSIVGAVVDDRRIEMPLSKLVAKQKDVSDPRVDIWMRQSQSSETRSDPRSMVSALQATREGAAKSDVLAKVNDDNPVSISGAMPPLHSVVVAEGPSAPTKPSSPQTLPEPSRTIGTSFRMTGAQMQAADSQGWRLLLPDGPAGVESIEFDLGEQGWNVAVRASVAAMPSVAAGLQDLSRRLQRQGLSVASVVMRERSQLMSASGGRREETVTSEPGFVEAAERADSGGSVLS